ncbi:MAG: BrnT family toxin [Deltaproteobacteria bacterium]|nr:BrnT family toxin [Deltaproteobacteria bacterium]
MFAWDSKKAEQNRSKHGVSFEEAATAFLDSDGLDGDDIKHSSYEIRSFRVARSALGRILTVIYTVRHSDDGKDEIRIISARRASRDERTAYHGQKN